MASGSYTVDDSAFPLVLVRFVGTLVDAEFAEYIKQAILWLTPLPFPYLICRDVPTAQAWVRQRMRDAGLDFDAPSSPVSASNRKDHD